MAKLMLQVNVAYPVRFIERFNRQSSERHEAGETRYWDGGEVEEKNRVYVIMDWQSVGSAKAFWNSEVGRDHIAAWKSIKTEFTVLEGKTH